MHISQFTIKNFKSLSNLTIKLNKDVNIFTGTNNSGKTTVLEALALWNECFRKIIRPAGKSTKQFKKGQYILGTKTEKYFPFNNISSVRSPEIGDIFFQKDKSQKIILSAELEKNGKSIEVGFLIGTSGSNLVIELNNYNSFNFKLFNEFFSLFPEPIELYYSSPVANVQQHEKFVTSPAIFSAIEKRESATVLRNRLYLLYRDVNTSLFRSFTETLSFVLYNNTDKITLQTESDIQRDEEIVFVYTTGSDSVPKDISLLGSGTLQIIEVLLNLFHSSAKTSDFHLVLLDEPDSHIHRDVQTRLLSVLTQFSNNNQICISTHNESLIRSTQLKHLFHLSRNVTELRSLGVSPFPRIERRHTGILPSGTSPLLAELTHANSIDFISALEADRIYIVEGADDALYLESLSALLPNNGKKYSYWVAGGIGNLLKDINSIKTVFSTIKNKTSLWEKSRVVFDRDFLTDKYLADCLQVFDESLGIKAFSLPSYTFESVLLTNLHLAARVLKKYTNSIGLNGLPGNDVIEQELQSIYEQEGKDKYESITDIVKISAQSFHSVLEKLNTLSKKRLKVKEIEVSDQVRTYLNQCSKTKQYYKLMDKNDVASVLNKVLNKYNHSFTTDNFPELFRCIDLSVWYPEFNFLNS